MVKVTQAPAEIWQGFLAAKDIVKLVNISRAHWHSLVKERRAPAPALRLGTRYTRWKASDIQSWLADPQGWIAAHAEVTA